MPATAAGRFLRLSGRRCTRSWRGCSPRTPSIDMRLPPQCWLIWIACGSGLDPEALTFAFHAAVDEARPTNAAAAGIDPEATRRTERPSCAARPYARRPVAPSTHPGASQRRREADARSHRLRDVLMIAALLLVCNEVIVGFRAGRVAAPPRHAISTAWTTSGPSTMRCRIAAICASA